jgi:hypothetical protein
LRHHCICSLALGLLISRPAHAKDGAAVDWASGLVSGDGVGVADRHAPTPAVARGTSRRAAEDAARRAIEKLVDGLPVAGGGTVGAAAKDPAVKVRLDRAIGESLTLDATPETDGAWRVTLAVPIEAVRQALAGPRTLGKDGDQGPAVVVVDGVTAKPAVGWTIGGIAGATAWVKAIPAWAKDAPHVKATGANHGAIEVTGMTATPATLFLIVSP